MVGGVAWGRGTRVGVWREGGGVAVSGDKTLGTECPGYEVGPGLGSQPHPPHAEGLHQQASQKTKPILWQKYVEANFI